MRAGGKCPGCGDKPAMNRVIEGLLHGKAIITKNDIIRFPWSENENILFHMQRIRPEHNR